MQTVMAWTAGYIHFIGIENNNEFRVDDYKNKMKHTFLYPQNHKSLISVTLESKSCLS